MNIAYPTAITTVEYGDSSGKTTIGSADKGSRGFLRHLWRVKTGNHGKNRLYWVDRNVVSINLYYSDDNGATWTGPDDGASLTWTEINKVDSVVTSDGNVHIVWAGTIGGVTDVYYRMWDYKTSSFGAAEQSVTGAIGDIEPRCAISANEDGQVCVFFQQWDAGPNRDIFATKSPFSSREGFTPGAQFDFSAEGLGKNFELLCCLTGGADALEHYRYTNTTDTWEAQISSSYFGTVITAAGDWSTLVLDGVLYTVGVSAGTGNTLFRSYTVAGGYSSPENVRVGGGTEINIGTDSAGGIYVTSFDDGYVYGYLYQRQSGPTWRLIDTRTDQIWAMPDVGAYVEIFITYPALSYQATLRLVENENGWGSTDVKDNGFFLEFDEESLSPGYDVIERDDKIQSVRESAATSLLTGQPHPGQEFQFQPRTDDCLMLLQSLFQSVDFIGTAIAGFGTGTFTFLPVEGRADWVGSTWGTVKGSTGESGDVYPISIEKSFGAHFGSRGENYQCGIVEELLWNQTYGEDLVLSPKCRFWNVQLRADLSESVGSFSQKDRFVDWKGTVSFSYGGTGTSLSIDRWSLSMNVTTRERGRLGTKAKYRYPFGKYFFDGSFDLELEDDFFEDIFTNSGSAALTMRWQNSDVDWIEIEHPQIMFLPHDRTVPPNEIFTYTLPYRAYPMSDGTPSTIVRVHTIFATQMFSFYL